ncbi:MAG: SRPBCC family protein [Candidatus Hydrogenedentales bacterium]
MLTGVLLVIAAVIVVFLIVVAMRPGQFRISRAATMAAPPAAVFQHVNDLHRWDAWSPWAKRDPNMKVTYSGAEAGTGARYAWVGNKDVGEGSMTITDSRSNERVVIQLEFMKPFRASNTADFLFEPVDGQTRVTWTMTGKNNFMFKTMGLFMNMDKMIGNDFEKGLAVLKAIVEGQLKIA